MKMTKKKVLVLALAVCLFAVASMGTLAWFNASVSITNTFKVATSTDDDADPEFSVELFETDPEGNPTNDGITYKDVLPGQTIEKDPTVENTGDYSQWIRVTVTLDNANAWTNAGGTTTFTELFSGSHNYGLTANIESAQEPWLLVSIDAKIDEDADTATWYLYLREELGVGETAQLFETVKIPGNFTLEEMAAFDEFTIKVQADALQREHTGNNAVEAFSFVGWEDGTSYDAE